MLNNPECFQPKSLLIWQIFGRQLINWKGAILQDVSVTLHTLVVLYSKEHYPFYPTDFDIKRICNRTDLNRNEVQLLWNQVWLNAVKENGKVDFEHFVKFLCPNAWVSNFIVHCCINHTSFIVRYVIPSDCLNMISFVF